ncbi:MAG: sensor histidine kinase [Reinekea sp.]
MAKLNSQHPTGTESFQWLIRTVIYLLTLVSAFRGLVIYASIWQSLLLVLIPLGLVLASEQLIAQHGRFMRLLYILVQLGLVAILFTLARNADFWSLLLLPACYITPRLFSGRDSLLIIGLITLTMIVCLWVAEEGLPSILFSSVYLVSYAMVYGFSRIILQLEQARHDAETLSRKLKSANSALRDYAEQSAEIATMEARHVVARDLHDSVTQTLFSLNLMLSSVLAQTESDDKRLASLQTIQQLSESAMKELRGIINHLRPATPPVLPFKAQLQQLVKDIQQQSNIQLTIDDDKVTVPWYAVTSVIRILREALLNVVKHAKCDQAQVRVQQMPGEIVFRVTDHGCGFDTSSATKGGHMGLDAMQQHSLELGAALTIDSHPAMGCVVTLTLPIKDRNDD